MRSVTLAVTLAALAPALDTPAQPTSIRTIAVLGQPAAHRPADRVYASWGPFYLDRFGSVQLGATVWDPDTTFPRDVVYYAETDEGLRVLIAEQEQVPGLPDGITFERIVATQFNDRGEYAVHAKLSADPNGIDPAPDAIFRDIGDGFELLALTESPAPPFEPGTVYGGVAEPRIGADGSAYFRGGVSPTPPGGGPIVIMAVDPQGAPRAVLRYPGPAAWLDDRSDLVQFEDDLLRVAPDGRLFSFALTFRGGTTPDDNQHFVRTGDDGTFETAARENDPIPDQPGDVRLEEARAFLVLWDIGRGGDFVKSVTLRGNDVTVFDDAALIADIDGSGLRTVFREGDTIPGIDDGRIAGVPRRPRMNSDGRIALAYTLTNTIFFNNMIALVSDIDGGEVRSILAGGDQAPGLAEGTIITGIGDPAFNDRGRIAFMARTSDGPLRLYVRDPNQEPRLVVSEGDLVDIGTPDSPDLRPIVVLENPLFRQNERGDVAFLAALDEDREITGWFVAHAPITCPADVNNDGLATPAD
ncbi:MAG: hypothetical protein AAFY46_08995, partial [Planctomycetota bacterium]